MSRFARVGRAVSGMLSKRGVWVVAGAVMTLLSGWLVVTRPAEAPHVGGLSLQPALYFTQWVVYAAIILLLGTRLLQYRRTLTPRQDIGFVFVATCLFTLGFVLQYTPFVREFPEGPFIGVVRTGVMLVCGFLGAMYGLSSTHRWH